MFFMNRQSRLIFKVPLQLVKTARLHLGGTRDPSPSHIMLFSHYFFLRSANFPIIMTCRRSLFDGLQKFRFCPTGRKTPTKDIISEKNS